MQVTLSPPKQNGRGKVSLELLHLNAAQYTEESLGNLVDHITLIVYFLSCICLSISRAGSTIDILIFYNFKNKKCYHRSGTVGQVDMKLICGTRIVGMSLRTRKGDKVNSYSFSLVFFFQH
jgi:hypothetical protein